MTQSRHPAGTPPEPRPIVASKGGVGKTTIALALAERASKAGLSPVWRTEG